MDTVALTVPDSAAEDADSLGAPSAKADSSGGMEWQTLSDSTSDSATAAVPVAKAAPPKASAPSGFFPDIPPDRESQVLMYAGAGLAAIGLVAFVLFNSSTSSTKTTNSGGSDNGGGTTNPDAPSQKTMTIQWAP
jgi:hypothetical protein